MKFGLFALLLCALVALSVGRIQKYKVKGKVTCPGNPKDAANTKFKLADEDDGPNPDDTLARGKADASGNFKLEGQTDELTRIDPKLKIYTDCNDGKPCQRKIKMKLPKSHIDKGWYDIGTINLEATFPGEGRDCF